MTVKEVRELVARGIPYKLVGAMTGKILAISQVNKESYISKFDDEKVAKRPLYVDLEISEIGLRICSQPVIIISVLGR
jgi:hypothetical protein|nr:MAG TPA: hypothetical protein [Caudoviricetes sp.]